jgi:hypothetical protein
MSSTEDKPKRKQHNPNYAANLAPAWKKGNPSPNPTDRTRGTEALERIGALSESLSGVVKQMNRFFSKIDKQMAALAENQVGVMAELAVLRTVSQDGSGSRETFPATPESLQRLHQPWTAN